VLQAPLQYPGRVGDEKARQTTTTTFHEGMERFSSALKASARGDGRGHGYSHGVGHAGRAAVAAAVPAPIGSQCSGCEYRLSPARANPLISGHGECWTEATGRSAEHLGAETSVLELYAATFKGRLIAEGKVSHYNPLDLNLPLLRQSSIMPNT